MITFILLSIFFPGVISTCPKTIIVNHTKEWTVQDKRNLIFTKKRCKVHYKEDICLKKFIKVKTRSYKAICGRVK